MALTEDNSYDAARRISIWASIKVVIIKGLSTDGWCLKQIIGLI